MKGNSQTIIPSSGNPSLISTNTTWTDPVYYIFDDIVVNANVTLTISDGVQLINFGDNNVSPIKSEDIIHNSRFIDQIDIGAYEKGDSYLNYSAFKTNTSIYPNPSSDLINIDSEFKINNIEILNTNGQLLFSKDKILSYNYTVDISKLSNGVYLIKLKTQSSTDFYKFIKY